MYWFTASQSLASGSSKSISRDLLAADGAVRAAHLDRHALDHVAMQPAVLRDQRRRFALQQLGEHFGARLGGERRVQLGDGGAHALDQQHVAVARALGRAAVRADVEAVRRGVAKLGEPRERGLLDMALGEARTHSDRLGDLLGVLHADFAGHQLGKEEVAGGGERACFRDVVRNRCVRRSDRRSLRTFSIIESAHEYSSSRIG